MRAFVVVMVIVTAAAGMALAAQKYPPVIRTIGPVLATPVPSPKPQQKIRLLTSITIQNRPDGDSTVAFEATDFARDEKQEHRVLGAEVYNLTDVKPSLEPLADKIMHDVRELEAEMLEFVERAGPPKERETILDRGAPQRPGTGAPARGR